jgi:hypothetical protein
VRLSEEEWERTLRASHLWNSKVSDMLRADRAAILESERDLLAIVGWIAKWPCLGPGEQAEQGCGKCHTCRGRAAIARAHREDGTARGEGEK